MVRQITTENLRPPAPPGRSRPARRRFAGSRRGFTGALLVAPAAILIAGLFVVPLVLDGWMSLNHWPLLGEHTFADLANYRQLFDDSGVRHALLFTVIFTAVIVPLVFATFVIQNSFAAIPEDLWEAAAVDGAGVWRNLRLALPLIRPGMITAGLFAFFTAWNEFFIVLVLLSNEPKYTLPVVLTTLLTGTLGSIHWGILDASVMITAVPCLILYAALQRHFVRGVMTGIGR